MQGVTVSWVGQSLALPKCSASSENKPRTRRTKEERRTMVTSFIKKYQSSNNGKFPSLNLTHKAVGGSFYTIREIVRDIIQENKVLGPGNPSSILLNLQYSSEEEEDEGSFLDVHRNISVSAIVSAMDAAHPVVDSSMEEQVISSAENTAVDKPVTLILSNTYLNEYSSWPVQPDEPSSVQGKFSDGIVLHEKVVKTETIASNIHVLTEKKDVAPGVAHQINVELQPSSPEDICTQYANQSVRLDPTSSGTSFIETELKNEDMHNKMPVERHFFEEGTNISISASSDSSRGTNVFFLDIVDDQSNSLLKHEDGQVFPLFTDNLGDGSFSETQVLAVSSTSQIYSPGHKVHRTSESENSTVINIPELESADPNSTNSIDYTSESSNIANKGVIPFIPLDKEHTGSDAKASEIASFIEREVDVASGPTEKDTHLGGKPFSFVDPIKKSENALTKLLEPIIQEDGHTELKAEEQSVSSGAVNGEVFISSSNEKAMKESEVLQQNPVWAAIKSFVSSFIKFWSE